MSFIVVSNTVRSDRMAHCIYRRIGRRETKKDVKNQWTCRWLIIIKTPGTELRKRTNVDDTTMTMI